MNTAENDSPESPANEEPKAKRAKRTDPHRPGAIIPAEYEYVLSYNCPSSQDGWPVPSFRVNCELDRRVEKRLPHRADCGRAITWDVPCSCDVGNKTEIINGQHDADGRCCIVGLLHIANVQFAATGGTGNCSVCGAAFVYGDVWRHAPTGEHIHLGHNCADKYELLADRSAYELEAGRRKSALAVTITRAENDEERRAFLAKNPGLEEALKLDHRILADLAARFQQYRDMSPKQVALALKIANEVKNPKAAEARVDAPEGKQTFRGRVVSVKHVTDEFTNFSSFKMTVKVTTPEGVWLAWGTAPALLLDQTVNHKGALRGAEGQGGTEVEITCTLKRGRDKGFAIMSRPRGKVVTRACGDECSVCKEEATVEGVIAFFRCGAPAPTAKQLAKTVREQMTKLQNNTETEKKS